MQLGSGSLTAPRPARRPPRRRSALSFLASSAPFFGGHRTRRPGAVSPTIFNRLWENLSHHDSLLKAPDKGQKRGSEASSAQQAPGDTVRPCGCASPPDCRGFGHAARSSDACEAIHRVRRIRTRSRATRRGGSANTFPNSPRRSWSLQGTEGSVRGTRWDPSRGCSEKFTRSTPEQSGPPNHAACSCQASAFSIAQVSTDPHPQPLERRQGEIPKRRKIRTLSLQPPHVSLEPRAEKR